MRSRFVYGDCIRSVVGRGALLLPQMFYVTEVLRQKIKTENLHKFGAEKQKTTEKHLSLSVVRDSPVYFLRAFFIELKPMATVQT